MPQVDIIHVLLSLTWKKWFCDCVSILNGIWSNKNRTPTHFPHSIWRNRHEKPKYNFIFRFLDKYDGISDETFYCNWFYVTFSFLSIWLIVFATRFFFSFHLSLAQKENKGKLCRKVESKRAKKCKPNKQQWNGRQHKMMREKWMNGWQKNECKMIATGSASIWLFAYS